MATAKLVVPCPAKINLFLAVGPLDERGYHPLRTVFQAISLMDTLSIEVADAFEFITNDPRLPAENTVTKALRLAAEVASLPPFRISLKKRIPSESGLGGGSSDAAGLLRALGHLLPRCFSPGVLAEIAAKVGADVAFFLVGGRARAEGYGERLTALPDADPRWLVLVRPSVGCSTPLMYRRLDEVPYAWRPFDPDPETLYNDFERVAPQPCLDLIQKLRALGADDAGLTGSGSAVFGRCRDRQTAERVAEGVRGEVGRAEGGDTNEVHVVRTLGRAESLALDSLPSEN